MKVCLIRPEYRQALVGLKLLLPIIRLNTERETANTLAWDIQRLSQAFSKLELPFRFRIPATF